MDGPLKLNSSAQVFIHAILDFDVVQYFIEYEK